MSTILLPYINPIKYHEVSPLEIPQYVSRHQDKYRFADTIPEWKEQIDYALPVHNTDRIPEQLTSDLGPVNLDILNAKGQTVYQDGFVQVLQDLNSPGRWVYEHDLDLSGLGLPEGIYYRKITAGTTSPTVLISEPLCICTRIENSLLLEYKHRTFYGDVFFETGYFPSIRVLGSLNLKSPASKDTLYEDQQLNETLLWSYPYDVWELIIGGAPGIPDYLIRKLNRIFGCSTLLIDGVAFAKNEGAKWEEKALENYPMRGWSIELREVLSRSSQVYENGAIQQKQFSIIAALDTKGFNTDSSGSEYRIIDII